MTLTEIDDRGLKYPINLLDDEKIRLGTSNDLLMYHTASNNSSYIQNITGTLFIESSNNIVLRKKGSTEKALRVIPDGTVELYYDNSKKLETTLNGVTVSGDVFLPDNNRFLSGTSNDLQLYHSGTDSFLLHIGTGNLKLQTNSGSIELNSANENMIKAVPNGAVELYHDNTKKLETSSGGVVVQGQLDVNGNATVDDNYKFVAGSNSDLQIYHNGSQNYINTSNGSIELRHTVGGANEPMLKAYPNGQVQLMYDSSTKLETTSTGIKVEGDNLEIYKYRSYNSDAATYQKIGTNNDSVDNNKVHQWRFGVTGNASSGSSFVFSNLRSQQSTYTEELRLHPDGGISFNGDTAEANALDDYEEGTWTPTFDTNAGSNTSGNCKYVKIGKVVHCFFRAIHPTTSSSSYATITGLPFTCHGFSVGVPGGAFAETNAGENLSMIVNPNQTFAYILKCDNSGVAVVSQSSISGKDFRGCITYFTQ